MLTALAGITPHLYAESVKSILDMFVMAKIRHEQDVTPYKRGIFELKRNKRLK